MVVGKCVLQRLRMNFVDTERCFSKSKEH